MWFTDNQQFDEVCYCICVSWFVLEHGETFEAGGGRVLADGL